MPRYKITFTTLFGYTDEREEEFTGDGPAIAYATVHARGRRAQVNDLAGRLIHDTRKVTGEDEP